MAPDESRVDTFNDPFIVAFPFTDAIPFTFRVPFTLVSALIALVPKVIVPPSLASIVLRLTSRSFKNVVPSTSRLSSERLLIFKVLADKSPLISEILSLPICNIFDLSLSIDPILFPIMMLLFPVLLSPAVLPMNILPEPD